MTTGKVCNGCYVSLCFPWRCSFVLSLSFFGGGLHGGETATAHLYLRLFADAVEHLKASAAVLFFDVCSAFATFLRRIVFDIDLGDEDWLRKLSSSGFTGEDIDYIYDFIKSNCVSATLEGDPGTFNNLAFNLAQQWYTNTWTSQEFIPNVTNTTAGSAAGTPMADLIIALRCPGF